MKKILFIALFIITLSSISQAQHTSIIAQDSSNYYKTPPYKLAVGVRFPFYGIFIDPGVSGKYFIGKKTALEASVGWNIAWQNPTVTLFATRNQRIFRRNNLQLFYGVGLSGVYTAKANMRSQQYDNRNHFYVGPGITAGLEYPLRRKPFVFGAEYRQVYYTFEGQDIHSKYFTNSTFGVTIRYIIK